MLKIGKGWLGAVSFTLLMQLLVVSASAQDLSYWTLVLLLGTAVAVGFFHVAFASGPLTITVLATLLAFYACFFVFMLRFNFPEAHDAVAFTAYLFPIIGFLLGAWLRRAEITALMSERGDNIAKPRGSPFAWLLPMILMSIGTLVPATQDLAITGQNLLLLVEMTVIGALALVMSANVTAFMLYTGEVFRGFFSRLRRLAAPALAFLSLYTLIVVVFGCLYRILDMLSQAPSFTIAGEVRAIQFTEALYFSVITMSTVGYGDITPLDDPIRVLVSVEIVLGVLLLLFGFAEIMKYARDPK